MPLINGKKHRSKSHTIQVPDWMWLWAKENDPKGREVAAAYLREFLGQKIFECSKPAPPVQEEPVREARPLPKPTKPRMPWVVRRSPRSSFNGRECWTVSLDNMENIERLSKTNSVVLILQDPNGTARYEVDFNQVYGDDSVIELSQNGEWWVVKAGWAHEQGLSGVTLCE